MIRMPFRLESGMYLHELKYMNVHTVHTGAIHSLAYWKYRLEQQSLRVKNTESDRERERKR